jgi:MinD-like ATPase involved in chromosome partitioning or flagellar assembly
VTAATADQAIVADPVAMREHANSDATRHRRADGVRVGPLLAVCGLAGGAGVTTLAYLIARAAARAWTDPILVADTGGPSGALSACAGVEVQCSLRQLACQLAAGVPLRGGIYATGHDGLRVLATGPEFSSPQTDHNVAHDHNVALLLAHARGAHALTVIDCDTLASGIAQTAAAEATHVAWVLTATPHGVRSARRVLEAAPAVAGNELVVARNDARSSIVPLRQLRRLAAARGAPLVLLPHLARLEAEGVEACAEEAQVPVQAILGALRR